MSDREIIINLKKVYDYLKDMYDNSDIDGKALVSLMKQVEKNYDEKYKVVDKKSLIFECSCPRCKNNLLMSDVINYDFVCEDCDENFYAIEVDTSEIEKDLRIPKKIIVDHGDNWQMIYNLGYVDENICYYINEDEGLYIDTKKMLYSQVDKIDWEELTTNHLFIDPEWDLGTFVEICNKHKENKSYIYMTEEMKNEIECYLKEELEIC